MRKQDKVALARHWDAEYARATADHEAYLRAGKFRPYSEEDETVAEYRAAREEFLAERSALLARERA